jgi:hypothetical protein
MSKEMTKNLLKGLNCLSCKFHHCGDWPDGGSYCHFEKKKKNVNKTLICDNYSEKKPIDDMQKGMDDILTRNMREAIKAQKWNLVAKDKWNDGGWKKNTDYYEGSSLSDKNKDPLYQAYLESLLKSFDRSF